MRNSRRRLVPAFAAAILIFGTVPAPASAEVDKFEKVRALALKMCRGKYKNRAIDASELKVVLDHHQEWLSVFPPS